MTKKQQIRWKTAAACRKNAVGSTARNDAVKKVSHAYLISDDISGDSKLRGYILHYTGAKYN